MSTTEPIPKKNTRRAYSATLSKFLSEYGNRDIHDLTSDEVLSFLNKITAGNKPQTKKIRYTRLNLDKRIRQNHLLRQIDHHIDFNFVYAEVEDAYGQRGNVSIPPPIILKMMLLLVLYNVRSERELMDTIPERLDWLWFLGYDLDDEVPNHSVLSKACTRWGVCAFQTFFDRIVSQCVQAGLVAVHAMVLKEPVGGGNGVSISKNC